MSHAFNEHRQSKVEHSRVAHITKGYAAGGSVHADEAEDKSLIKKTVKKAALKMDGKQAKHRADRRPRRASGGAAAGRNKKGGKTIVNVITGGQHPGMPMMPPPGPAGAAPMPAPPPAMPPRPPMMAPPGGPPMGAGMPPGMPPRNAGGRTYAKGGRALKRADGGANYTDEPAEAPMTAQERIQAGRRARSAGETSSPPSWGESWQAAKEIHSGKVRKPIMNPGEQMGEIGTFKQQKRGGRTLKRADGGRTDDSPNWGRRAKYALTGAGIGTAGGALAAPVTGGASLPIGAVMGGAAGYGMARAKDEHEGSTWRADHQPEGRARGGRSIKDGPAYKEGLRNGTQVTHSPGKNDQAGLNRGKPITYKRGGPVESSGGIAPATKLPGGSGGGEARLVKERRAARGYARA